MRALFLVIMLFTALVAGCHSPSELQPPSELKLISGEPFDLHQQVEKSKATVLIFTRTDCPISNRYAPTVSALWSTFQPRGVDFFLVYVDPRQRQTTLAEHLKEYQYPCNGVHDPLHELVKLSGATITPEAAIFTSQQKIAYLGRIDNLFERPGQSRPAATTHELADAIDAVLAGKSVEQPRTKAVGCIISDLK
jgi:peroxiredoxin